MATTLVLAGAVVQSALRRHLNLWIPVLPYRRGDGTEVKGMCVGVCSVEGMVTYNYVVSCGKIEVEGACVSYPTPTLTILLNAPTSSLPFQPPELDVGYTGDVIEAIKSTIAAGESTDEVLVKMTYLAVPYYVLTADALDKKLWFDTMKRALNEIKNMLEQYRWSRFGVSETDDHIHRRETRWLAAMRMRARHRLLRAMMRFRWDGREWIGGDA